MAEAIGSSYGENQSSSEFTCNSDDEYPPDPSTASANGRGIKQDYILYEVKWLKRNKTISSQERRRIQQEIQNGRKPGEPMTSLLRSLTLPANLRENGAAKQLSYFDQNSFTISSFTSNRSTCLIIIQLIL